MNVRFAANRGIVLARSSSAFARLECEAASVASSHVARNARGAVRAFPRCSRPIVPPPLLDAEPLRNGATAGAQRLATHVGGEPVELLAERAIYWPRERTLFVADVHLGKGAAFRAGGVPIPRGTTAGDLARLSRLIDSTAATRLVVLGDFLHAASGRVDALDAAFRRWRGAYAATAVVLVRGNHDAHAGDPPASWAIDVVGEPHALPPFLACHRPMSPPTGYALCGHVHPGVWVTGRARESARLPCFVVGRQRALLPAFGGLTGLATIAPAPDETVVVVAGERLFRLPRI
jgi:DNA ligase-associated metallophosphoesterase